tara:strand:- start:402 stop:650 length:249 start_codon:yes stop_codon:yes gene_type:complete
MMFALTFLLVAVLESAAVHDNDKKEVEKAENIKDPDMCVGCDNNEDKKEENEENTKPQLKAEIRIDPVTGEVLYVIKGLVIE